ncbi:MAG: hypothetical protein KGL35_07835 [Bradyrhizobium sp.]|uniref:hypothetical protein n=1 Tax=Bradyrhizobium sp. TaxID=376 RepID=UPI001C28B71F|nr:hypothetical protein [Bradyrhizobium sp.]MBU6465029.1 hypothetical protein [Pseudomonadota bacterium]MDE2066952.1 hypothetical protein [Bradyrhizobium sp.]MDE2468639.1 hypothetical protein [Bradyrhizobium sp.]
MTFNFIQFYREDEIPTLGQCTGITPAFALDLAWPVKIPCQSPICANPSKVAQSDAGSRTGGGSVVLPIAAPRRGRSRRPFDSLPRARSRRIAKNKNPQQPETPTGTWLCAEAQMCASLTITGCANLRIDAKSEPPPALGDAAK